jgi:hypothetical protein
MFCVLYLYIRRLISGLQASISTQIAKEYFYADANGGKGRWGTNVPMFIRAVGSHPQRISNLYFTFLFMVRAIAKASDLIQSYNFRTDNTITSDNMEYNELKHLVTELVTMSNTANINQYIQQHNTNKQFSYFDVFGSHSSIESSDGAQAASLCKTGFDESSLFQV